ncbi:DUF983 domain-containing protein [Flavobacteriaceae bacterium F08102]|nr:DUF983 domain-containing protein [Flavobacteriaceae bacterium F08102]
MKILKKGSKLNSIFNNKCPRCQEGDFFIDHHPYHLKSMMEMYKTCPSCGLKYEIEPSFFQGAMYVSYGLTVAIAITMFAISLIFDIYFVYTLIALAILLVVLTPLTYRFARLIYINMFVNYQEK